MDEFLDHLFSSSSWSDVNPTERSSWVCSGSDQTNGLLPDLMGVYEGNENNSPTSLVPSNQIIESLDTQGTSSIFVGGDPNYGPGKCLLPGEAQPQKGTDHESKPSLNGVVNGSLKSGYSGLQLNTTTLTPAVLNLSSPKVLPVVGSLAKSPHAIPESDSVGSNGNELSGCQQSLGDSHSLPSIPQLWPPPSYGSVSSISPVRGQNKLQGFGVQEEFVDTDNNVLGNRYLGDDKFLQLENLPESLSGKDELHNNHLSSYVAGPPITLSRTAGLQSQVQMPQLNEGNSIKHYMNQAPVSQLQSVSAAAAAVCNGAVKPRVRARRGQATDPHSIAERLRREKIAERMKNLQELVPNSNKTDKASMLDEIIEYVKFLQLQVKVLSMSRLGAAGAVVPLLTDGQAEGSSGVLLSSSNGQAADPSESLDSIAFEQEVAKLMESNVTMAMQYLQSKGLCLMPIALAAAISGGKPSSGPFFGERKKPSLTHGLVPQNNGSLGSGTRQMSSDGEIVTKENVMGNHNREANGAFIKQEEVKNTLCPTGELKPKA